MTVLITSKYSVIGCFKQEISQQEGQKALSGIVP